MRNPGNEYPREEYPDHETWRIPEAPISRRGLLTIATEAIIVGAALYHKRNKAIGGVDEEDVRRLNHEGEANAYFTSVTEQLASGHQVRAMLNFGTTYIDGDSVIKNPLMFVGEKNHFTLMGYSRDAEGNIELLEDGTPKIISIYMGDSTQTVESKSGSTYSIIVEMTLQLVDGRVVIADDELPYFEDILGFNSAPDLMSATAP